MSVIPPKEYPDPKVELCNRLYRELGLLNHEELSVLNTPFINRLNDKMRETVTKCVMEDITK